MGIAALILGIVGLLIAFIPFVGIVGIVLTLLAVIFGAIGLRKREGRGLAIAGLVLGVIGSAVAISWTLLVTRAVHDAAGDSKAQLVKVRVQQIAHEYFPRWALKTTDKACPDTLLEVVRAVDPSPGPDDANDPWGKPLKFYCGDNLPPGAKGFAVYSVGEDGKEGTSDDIKSW